MEPLREIRNRLLNGWQLSKLHTFEVAARHQSPPTNRMAACSVQMGFAGGWRGSWRPESPWLGVSARLTS